MNRVVKSIISFVLIGVLAFGVVIGNQVAGMYESELSSFLSPAIVDEESLAVSSVKGQEMASRIMEEGAVLLKNNGALPLSYTAENKKVNVFGWRSIEWIYGSEGQNSSGGTLPEDGDFSKNVDLLKALKSYGISYNERLEDMYFDFMEPKYEGKDFRGEHINNLMPLREPSINDKTYYTDELLEYSESYSDVAIVVIGRLCGENMIVSQNGQPKLKPGAASAVTEGDRHFLEISTEEEELLTYVGSHYETVIVVLNMANAFECSFLETIPGIDACLYVGYTGTRAASAIPKLLYGEVSPSGHTVDTFAYDVYTNPANIYSERFNAYTNFSRSYNDFIENIYVGYKWYETADAEGYWKDYSNQFGTGFDAVVQYPFGYGLSYNEYDWEVTGISYYEYNDEDNVIAYDAGGKNEITHNGFIDIAVKVTNNGNYPGRDVVQAYVTVPYTKGGIEKTALQLVGYAKTNLLQPGTSETIIVSIDVNDFTSYDCYDKNNNGHKGYELEAGKYTVSLRSDSHNVKEVLDSGMPAINSFDVSETIKITNDKYTGQVVKNLFTGADAVDAMSIDGVELDGTDPGIFWITRENLASLDEIKASHKARAATPSAMINPHATAYRKDQATEWNNATVDAFGNPVNNSPVTWGANNGLKLYENGKITELGMKLGEDYYAEEWDALLDQLTIDECLTLINKYYTAIAAIKSIGTPKMNDYDGPAQIKGFTNDTPRGTAYPTMVVLASCWNQTLAYQFGQSFGDDMKSVGVNGLWGWAIDNHRTVFFSRNHESPSEDCILAGYTIMNAVKGLNTRGRYCFLKHFALYDCGQNSDTRSQRNTSYWLTEQSLRENQLRAYYKPFVIGGALGAMTTYRGIGAEASESTTALIMGVLRGEWQFKGAITSDHTGTTTVAEALLRSGGNLAMGNTLITDWKSTENLRFQNRLREAMHETIYMWLRAEYYERDYQAKLASGEIVEENSAFISSVGISSWEWWRPALSCVNVFATVTLGAWGICTVIDLVDPDKRY